MFREKRGVAYYTYACAGLSWKGELSLATYFDDQKTLKSSSLLQVAVP